jgi:hypothetical protein
MLVTEVTDIKVKRQLRGTMYQRFIMRRDRSLTQLSEKEGFRSIDRKEQRREEEKKVEEAEEREE